MTKTEEFIELVKRNPTLPVIPMVGEDVVSDDCCSRWMGSFGYSEVTEYYMGRDYVHFKSDDEESVLCDMVGCEYSCDKDGNDVFDLSDEEWNKLYQSIPWVKAIVVYIDEPEV